MFDIVAAHQHELALPVEVIGVDNAQARLPAAPHASPDAGAEQEAV